MRSSIRGQLVWLVLIISVPLAVATLLAIRNLDAALRNAQEQTLVSTTRALAAAVNAELEKFSAVGGALATSALLERGQYEEFHKRAAAALKSLPDSWVAVADKSGQQVVNTLLPFGQPLPKVNTTEYHERAMKSGMPVVGGVIAGSLARRSVIGVYVPSFSAGEPRLDVIVTIDPRVFNRILADQQLPPGWVTGIGDDKGRFVARSIDHERFLGEPISEGWRAASLTGIEGTFDNISKEGVPLHSAFKNIVPAGWTVSVGASAEILRASVRSSIWNIGLSAVGLVSVGLVLAWIVARRITRSMQSLQKASTALIQNQSIEVRQTGLTEVDQAISAFESAAASIREREKHHAILVNELNHRVKNTLAVVQSIAHLGLRNATSLAQFGDSFGNRVSSLAKTHDLLTSKSWDTVELRDLVANQLSAYQDETGTRIDLQGERVVLAAAQAVPLSMLVHELTTNAAKHGALSRGGGSVKVAWRLDGDKVVFDWSESGGPIVVHPERLSFGSRLIAAMATELRAETKMDFNPEGLRFVLVFPIQSKTRG